MLTREQKEFIRKTHGKVKGYEIFPVDCNDNVYIVVKLSDYSLVHEGTLQTCVDYMKGIK